MIALLTACLFLQSLCARWIASGKAHAKTVFGHLKLNQRKVVRDSKSAVAMIFLLKTYQKRFLCYHLPWSFKIFVNVFAFLCVKANSKEICEEISFPSFSRKMLTSVFCCDSMLIISKKCVATPSPCKDLHFPHGPNLAQKPLYLAGTVLNLKLTYKKGLSSINQNCQEIIQRIIWFSSKERELLK